MVEQTGIGARVRSTSISRTRSNPNIALKIERFGSAFAPVNGGDKMCQLAA